MNNILKYHVFISYPVGPEKWNELTGWLKGIDRNHCQIAYHFATDKHLFSFTDLATSTEFKFRFS